MVEPMRLTAVCVCLLATGCKDDRSDVSRGGLTLFENGNPRSMHRPQGDVSTWSTDWHSTGEIKGQVEFVGAVPTGRLRLFGTDGTLLVEVIKSPDTGELIQHSYSSMRSAPDYAATIFLSSRATLKDGELNGEGTYYTAPGVVNVVCYWKDDKRHGCFTRYYGNGRIACQGDFDQGKMSGEWAYFDEEGAVLTFEEAKKEGLTNP